LPLTLLTGPANAEKAGHVMAAYRGAIDRDPLLVVPTRADVERYRRELAAGGAVFGVEVLTFGNLVSEIARRTGLRGRALGALTRERVAAAAVKLARLDELAASAATAGFPRALLGFVDELEALGIDAARMHVAARAWGTQEPARARYAEELARLYGAYRDLLDDLGRRDGPLQQRAALDALRLAPAAWGGAPVFLYGFDDLTPLQQDAVETLALHAGAPVTVSLTYEPGRVAFAGRGATFQALLALGAEHVALPARADHYASAAREALHHLERSLFETEPTRPRRARAGGALLLLEGGDERAELELVAAHVARLLREGVPAEEVAVVLRAPWETGALLERVFAAAAVPIALSRRLAAGHTALGRGAIALLRAALPDGGAEDLLTWLRSPGKLQRPALADRLEADVRTAGVTSALAARELWEQAHPSFVLAEVDRVAAAAARGPAALCERLAAETAALLAAPWRGRAPVLAGAEALDARVAAELRRALAELAALSRDRPALAPAPEELADLLGRIEVFAGESPRAGLVTVTSPQAIRARRVRALFLCQLQQDAFPRPATPEPFLGDAERRALNAAAGLRLALREDRLDAERYLFYAAVSRPTDLLALAWHTADADGDPVVRSLFVDDVLDLFEPRLEARKDVRPIGSAGFAGDRAPTERERALALAAAAPRREPELIAPLREAAVLEELQARETWSASALEAWAGCPVKWFVERLLDPEDLVPDPEPMLRGELAHRVLEEVVQALSREAGGPLRPDQLPQARARLVEALARHAEEVRISVNPERLRAALRRLEADLLRYLEGALEAGSEFAPRHFELRFGAGEEDTRPPAPLAGGELMLAGRIDRVDVAAGGDEAIVYDYKGKSAPARAKWLADAKLQVGLYMLALPRLLGLEAAGGLYQPLGGEDNRPRGLLREDADPSLRVVDGDRAPAEELEQDLRAVLERALEALRGIRAGRLEPCPATCAYKGGCAFPAICRTERA
jgi:ATP-dependent helicase/DNAse subunit B